MTIQQFGRTYKIRIGPSGLIGKEWSDIRCVFDIERDSAKPPNKAKFELYNLSRPSADAIQLGGLVVQFFGGYGFIPSLLFSGDISRRGVKIDRQGSDRVVNIEAGDAELAWRDSRFNWNFGPGTPNSTILTTLLGQMGIGLGLGDPLPPVIYGSGVTYFGPARKALTQLMADAGVEWSIQDGNLLILLPGSGSKDGIALVTPQTGLIGAPTPTKNGVDVRALLNPRIAPGRFCKIISETVKNGFYRIRKVRHQGDTHGSDWTTSFEATFVGEG